MNNKKYILIGIALILVLAVLITVIVKTSSARNKGKEEIIITEDNSAYANTRGANYLDIQPLQSQVPERTPIKANLIIDTSSAFTEVKDEIYTWLSLHLDQVLAPGDEIAIWSTGNEARIVYSGEITTTADKNKVKNYIRDLTGAGNTPDFSGAFQQANRPVDQGFISYTLLITASPESIKGTAANYLKYSRVEEFSKWRAIVVGLNLDEKIKKAAAVWR